MGLGVESSGSVPHKEHVAAARGMVEDPVYPVRPHLPTHSTFNSNGSKMVIISHKNCVQTRACSTGLKSMSSKPLISCFSKTCQYASTDTVVRGWGKVFRKLLTLFFGHMTSHVSLVINDSGWVTFQSICCSKQLLGKKCAAVPRRARI